MRHLSRTLIRRIREANLKTSKTVTAADLAVPDVRVVYDVPEAGAKLGLSRNGSYEAAARGEIPTIRIGRLLKVPKVAFDRMLDKPKPLA
jgi:hypothetical protein